MIPSLCSCSYNKSTAVVNYGGKIQKLTVFFTSIAACKFCQNCFKLDINGLNTLPKYLLIINFERIYNRLQFELILSLVLNLFQLIMFRVLKDYQ